MNIDEVKVGQRVRFAPKRRDSGDNRIETGMEGVVAMVPHTLPSGTTGHKIVSVIWVGLTDGWPYEPLESSENCLREEPTFPNAPKFGEDNGWAVLAEDIEPLEEE